MTRALSVQEVLSMKKAVFPFESKWEEAFGIPERTGVWFIWGNSGNGKTSFVMQLCKELCKFGRVAYDSLEEGDSLSMQNSLKRIGMSAVNRKFLLLNCEPIDELGERIGRRKSPDFFVVDSFQYAQMSYKEYIRFKEAHRDKLIIFTSHADGRNPSGRAAKSVMYDATLKIWVEGYKAFSKGRFIGSTGEYVIWSEGAERYWGEKQELK
jgi:molybdopterin-guanine dinucleotide biosynthesis protein